jgi:hypothetical protein
MPRTKVRHCCHGLAFLGLTSSSPNIRPYSRVNGKRANHLTTAIAGGERRAARRQGLQQHRPAPLDRASASGTARARARSRCRNARRRQMGSSGPPPQSARRATAAKSQREASRPRATLDMAVRPGGSALRHSVMAGQQRVVHLEATSCSTGIEAGRSSKRIGLSAASVTSTSVGPTRTGASPTLSPPSCPRRDRR